MMKNILRAGAFMFALMLLPLAPASAHDKHGRRHRRARVHRQVARTHDDERNETPGIPRRVRRGRNETPGTPRGSLEGMTPSTFPTGEGRRLGAAVRRDGNRGVGKGVGRSVGGGRGHGKH